MEVTLDDVRSKFPTVKYAPRVNCKYCNGTGERLTRPGLPCICVFVDHDLCDFAAESLAETARKILSELEGCKDV